MQILIILSSADPEVKWNAIRLGNMMLKEGETVTIFLSDGAVDLLAGDSADFPIAEQAGEFAQGKGILAARGKDMAERGVAESKLVRLSSLQYLYDAIGRADRVLNF